MPDFTSTGWIRPSRATRYVDFRRAALHLSRPIKQFAILCDEQFLGHELLRQPPAINVEQIAVLHLAIDRQATETLHQADVHESRLEPLLIGGRAERQPGGSGRRDFMQHASQAEQVKRLAVCLTVVLGVQGGVTTFLNSARPNCSLNKVSARVPSVCR